MQQNTTSRPQVTAAQASVFPRRVHVRPISQVNLELRDGSGGSALEVARDQVLDWMDRLAAGRLPKEAWQGEGFLLEDIGAQRAEAEPVNDFETLLIAIY